MEKEHSTQPEPKIHKTHFPVVKTPLQKTDYDSGYEWVKSENGRLRRVPKKVEEKTPDNL